MCLAAPRSQRGPARQSLPAPSRHVLLCPDASREHHEYVGRRSLKYACLRLRAVAMAVVLLARHQPRCALSLRHFSSTSLPPPRLNTSPSRRSLSRRASRRHRSPLLHLDLLPAASAPRRLRCLVSLAMPTPHVSRIRRAMHAALDQQASFGEVSVFQLLRLGLFPCSSTLSAAAAVAPTPERRSSSRWRFRCRENRNLTTAPSPRTRTCTLLSLPPGRAAF
jgi:hypothetical protein